MHFMISYDQVFLDLKKLKDERSQTLKRYALETLENRHLLLAGTGDDFYHFITY